MVGTSERALTLVERMKAEGVLVHPVIAPAVGEGAARLRFFVTVSHTERQVEKTVSTVDSLLRSSA